MSTDRKRPGWLSYGHLADAIPGGVLAFDECGHAIYANACAESLLGLSTDEILGRMLEELTTTDWADAARIHLRQVRNGERATFDFCFSASLGSETWARVSMTPVIEEEHYVGAIAIVSDISGERRVENRLREAELRLREAAAYMPGIIYELHFSSEGEFSIEYVSEGITAYTGESADTMILEDKDPLSYLHEEDARVVLAKAIESVQTLQPVSLEFRFINGDAVHHMYTACSVAQAEHGAITFSGVAIDVGDVKRTETKLRASQAQLNAVFDNFPFECWTLDLEGRFLLQNPSSKRRWGVLRGETVSAVDLPEEAIREWAADTAKAQAGQVARRDLIVQIQGRRRHFRRLVVPILDGDDVLGVLGVSVDTTEQRYLEEQLAHSQKLDAIGRLAGGIAHDFNNVLTAIMSCVRLLERRLDGPPRRELQIIRDGAQRASELTRQLLAFAKQEMVEPRRASADDIVLKSDRLLRRLIGEDIELVTLANPRGWEVVVDPVRLEQAIINLVLNARDAMPRGGKITLRCEGTQLAQSKPSVDGAIPPGQYALISVEDCGVGMTEEIKLRAFEPFFTTRQEVGGTGLGLSSVYGSVHQAQGYVTLESTLGEGTRISLYLPLAEGRAQMEEDLADGGSAATGGTETILVVEDEPLVMSVACQSLQLSGYTVLQARSQHEALKLSRAHSGTIHLLLTDVIMPHGSGPELAEILRAERPGISVLFMSGYTSDRIDSEVENLFFLPKPFTPDHLDAHVREALDGEGHAQAPKVI